jgi:hypothetical protein
MPKSKSSRDVDRTKRAPRDPSPERELEARRERSDGVVDAEMEELDTDKYEPPPRKDH